MSATENLCEDCSTVAKATKLTINISKAAGPGSRGGQIIGTTKSGKPIYQHGGGTENYHAIDHTDAAESHGAHGMLARVKGDVGGMNHHRAMAKEHLDAAAGPKPSAYARPIHQRIKEHFSNMGGMGGAAMAHAKSFSERVADLSKGVKRGEGSRGGHILGHTKSGKPIYSNGSATSKFSKQDHVDAIWAHGFNVDAHEDDGSKASEASVDAKQKHMDALTKLHGGDEGKANDAVMQHDGHHVSGEKPKETKSAKEKRLLLGFSDHTRRKAVYENLPANHKIYSRFSAQEHINAMHLHNYSPRGNEDFAKQHYAAATKLDRNVSPTYGAFSTPEEKDYERYDKSMNAGSTYNLGNSPITENRMNSIQILKSYLAKSKVRSGNVDADTVDEVDGDLTGASAMGKDENAPGGWDDQPAADKKVKNKFKGHDQSDSKNAGRSVEAQTEVGSVSVNHTTLSSAGPYDCDGGDVSKISEPSPTKTIDGNVYRSMTDDDDERLVKGVKRGEGSKGGHIIGHTKSGKPVSDNHEGAALDKEGKFESSGHLRRSQDDGGLSKAEGSRGGKVIGHTKSGKAVYVKKTGHKGYTGQDHHDAAEIHLETAGKHLQQFRSDKSSAKQKDDAAAKIDHHLALSDHFRRSATIGKKSLDAPDFYKGGNGKMYQRQVHDFGVVQHTAGGMDQYCAELAKGGSFWANGSHWHNTSDPGVAQMVMCKSCDHAHSVMYTACPECEASGDFSKSMAQPSLHFAAPVRPIEPESDIVRFK